MGVTHVTVRVSELGKKLAPFEGDFLVDTGAVDCMAPGDRLQAAGVEPTGKDVYELASGDAVEYEYGYAWISFLGEETTARIIFGPPDIEPILGVIALENAGMGVDPVTQQLKRLGPRPLKRINRQ